MDVNAKDVGEFLAYGSAVFYAFYLIAQNIYAFIKKTLDKKKEAKSAGVVVNVGIGDAAKMLAPEFIDAKDKFFLYFLLEQSKIQQAMHDMKSNILKEQMDYYNRHITKFKISLTNVMIDLLREAGINDDSYTTYFSNFENFVDIVECKVQNMFRNMCKENHFSEYTPSEFKTLIERNSAILSGTVAELLRKRYPQKAYIKNFDRVYKLHHELTDSFADCFMYAREVAIDEEKIIKEARDCFEQQIHEIIGIKYSLKI